MTDLINKIPTIIKMLTNPNWKYSIESGKNQTQKFIFAKEIDGETVVVESVFFRKRVVNKCIDKAPKIQQRNRQLVEDLQLEILSDLGECDMYLNLNHSDGNRIEGLTRHVEVKTCQGDDPRVLGLRRHKKAGPNYDGIYTVVLVPFDWTGRTIIYWRGINFTIERK